MEPWEIEESRYLLERRWMRLREDRVRLPSGVVFDEFHVIEYPSWSCVYCLTTSGEVVLVEQYRHGMERSSLELPAGEIGKAESPLEAARRELLEETGYEASDWRLLGACAPNPSKEDSLAHLYVATHARVVQKQRLDRSEDIRVRLMEPAEVLRRARTGGIVHGIHLAAIFWTEIEGAARKASESATCRSSSDRGGGNAGC